MGWSVMPVHNTTNVIFWEQSGDITGQGSVRQARRQSVEMIIECSLVEFYANASPWCNEKKGKTTGYRISSRYDRTVRLPYMTTRRVLLSNEMASQTITSDFLAMERMIVRLVSHYWPGYLHRNLRWLSGRITEAILLENVIPSQTNPTPLQMHLSVCAGKG